MGQEREREKNKKMKSRLHETRRRKRTDRPSPRLVEPLVEVTHSRRVNLGDLTIVRDQPVALGLDVRELGEDRSGQAALGQIGQGAHLACIGLERERERERVSVRRRRRERESVLTCFSSAEVEELEYPHDVKDSYPPSSFPHWWPGTGWPLPPN